MFEFIRKFVMKRKLEEINYIIGLMNKRIIDKKYLILVSTDGSLESFTFYDEKGNLDRYSVDRFLADVKEDTEDMVMAGVVDNPSEAISITLASFADAAMYKKMLGDDLSELSYVR